MNTNVQNPTRRVIAEGALAQLPDLLAPCAPTSLLLVLGQRSFRESAHYKPLRRALSGSAVVESPPVPANPPVAWLDATLKSLKAQGASWDVVLGVGGGSVLDAGKMLAALLPQEWTELKDDVVERPMTFPRRPLPFFAVPTTAGTGSEVTPYASLSTDSRKKITVEHRDLFPNTAVVDPLLTHSMPPYVTACTGFDALCQAIESYWSMRHTSWSDTHALQAIPRILSSLESAVRAPGDRQARADMSMASCEAGLAISQTRTTAVHAVSYPLTTHFGIAHGHACALTLAPFIRYHEDVLEGDRGATLWRALGTSSAEEAAGAIERLMEAVGLERALSRLEIDSAGIERVVAEGFRPDRVGNNPRALTPEALREILHRLG